MSCPKVLLTVAAHLAVLGGSFQPCRAADPVPSEPPPLDAANLDRAIKPAADFYHFADGGWIATHPIPPEYPRWGSFEELAERNNAILHGILDDCAAGPGAAGSIRQKVGDFFASGMDEKAIEAAGIEPLGEEFGRIKALQDRGELPTLIAHLHDLGINVGFALGVRADDKNSTMNIAQIHQAGLGLPDRDYYTKEDEASKKLRAQYEEHVAKMFTLLGDPAHEAAAEAKTVLTFETELAKASKTRVALRDPEANYHKMSLADAAKSAPGFDLNRYFVAAAGPRPADINVRQPEFLAAVSHLAADAPLNDWKTYLAWQVLHSTAPYLPPPFVDENFRFFGQIMSGSPENLPRWKRVLRETDTSLGEALGQLYVEKTFTPEAKARALTLVSDLRGVLRDRLSNLEWMGPETRTAAVKKIDALTVKIGYPDKWRDYTKLEIKRQPYVLNVLAARAFESQRDLAKIDQPVDKSEWGMTPPTVNAYYNPSQNEIVFPAGILQPPFFNASADDAVNYGGIGGVIGHEMTHGFDDQGRQYDAQGNLKNWWSPEDLKNFNERSQKIVAQFDGYTFIDGIHVNGRLTEGENIADLGGSKIAYTALEKVFARAGGQRPADIGGFTPEQRFFLAWAQVWRNNVRPEMARQRLITDPHSPGEFRCNGPLSNLPEFQKAFNVPDGSPMVRPAAERVQIW